MTPAEAASVLQHSKEVVTVVAYPDPDFVCSTLVVASVNRPRGTKTGLGITRHQETVFISSINPTGPFAKTDLRVGMRVVKINNTLVDNATSGQIAYLLSEPEHVVTILALSDPSAPRTSQGSSPTAPMDVESGLPRPGVFKEDPEFHVPGEEPDIIIPKEEPGVPREEPDIEIPKEEPGFLQVKSEEPEFDIPGEEPDIAIPKAGEPDIEIPKEEPAIVCVESGVRAPGPPAQEPDTHIPKEESGAVKVIEFEV